MKIYSGFGATVAIINGEEECNKTYDTHAGAHRYVNFQGFLGYFGLYAGEGYQSCAVNYQVDFPYNGSQNSFPQWYTKGKWNEKNTCNLVKWEVAG